MKVGEEGEVGSNVENVDEELAVKNTDSTTNLQSTTEAELSESTQQATIEVE